MSSMATGVLLIADSGDVKGYPVLDPAGNGLVDICTMGPDGDLSVHLIQIKKVVAYVRIAECPYLRSIKGQDSRSEVLWINFAVVNQGSCRFRSACRVVRLVNRRAG